MTRIREMAWWVVITLALALGVWFAGRATVNSIRAQERREVFNEAATIAGVLMQHERDSARRVVDSLRVATAKVDTVLVRRIRTIHDTAWLPADTATPVRYAACRATLDTLATECAQFRETATAALTAAATQRAQDSTHAQSLSVQLAAMRRADADKAAQLAARSRWRTVERGACVGVAAFTAFTILRR